MAINFFNNIFSRERNKKIKPSDTLGTSGPQMVGGRIENNEKNKALNSHHERYRIYSEMLANANIVAAGTRYFLNVVSGAKWSVLPNIEHPRGEEFALLAEKILFEDPLTPWNKIVRRAAMSRFYGFSVQEWTAFKRKDGIISFFDIDNRSQKTIEKWDVDETGKLFGCVQKNPNNFRETYLPMSKLLYTVDDTLNDTPEGMGLFRHLIESSQRLFRYEQLEGIGLETNLKNIPIIRYPESDLLEQVAKNEGLTDNDVQKFKSNLTDFINNQVRGPDQGLILDSKTYETQDEAGRPSNIYQWDVELLKGSVTSFGEIAAAIERVNREMARILGVEQLMLGGDRGSNALSEDKTRAFFLMANSTLFEIKESVTKHLLERIWQLNGFDPDTMPELQTEDITFVDNTEVVNIIKMLSDSGAPLDPRDPVIDEIRQDVGLSRRPEELVPEITNTQNSQVEQENDVTEDIGDLEEDNNMDEV